MRALTLPCEELRTDQKSYSKDLLRDDRTGVLIQTFLGPYICVWLPVGNKWPLWDRIDSLVRGQ